MTRVLALILGPLYPRVIGGAEILARLVSKRLGSLGFSTDLVGVVPKGFPGPLVPDDPWGEEYPFPKSTILLPNLAARLCRRYMPDVVLSIMGHSSLLGCLIKFLGRVRGHATVFAGVDAAYLAGRMPDGGTREYLAYLASMKVAFPLCGRSGHVALSPKMREMLIRGGIRPSAVRIIPTPVEEVFFDIEADPGAGRILYIGRLEPIKGIDVLIRAFYDLVKERGDVELVLVGNGSMERRIREIARSGRLRGKIRLVGVVPYGSVGRILAGGGILTLPSRMEGLPMAMLQGMAAGLPIVATAVGGIPDVLRDGRNGLVVRPNSPDSLKKALEVLLEDEELARRLGEAAREDARPFSLDRVARMYANLVEDLEMGNIS